MSNIIKFPTGRFKVTGGYFIDTTGPMSETEQRFSLEVLLAHGDYDDDTAFPEDEVSRVFQEAVSKQLPENHFDLQLNDYVEL